MKVGIALNMLSEPGRPDMAVASDHLAMGDLAEPLGFDSLFALEHHFTGYAMSPAPLELLAYFAGRTKRIIFGTAVIVLPWHDPIRVAEGIELLDILSGGRCLFGFGRGAASVEYAGFRIPMEEARPRFAEAAQLIRKALREPEFEWQGQFYQIPRTSIRPRPISHPEERFFASSVRRQDVVGTLLDFWASDELQELDAISATLAPEGRTPGEMVPVRLHARATEAGTLELEAVPRSGDERWKVEFDVRGERQEGGRGVA